MRRRAFLLILLLLAAIIGGTGLWLRAQRRQYALNRALIAALDRGDDKRAIALVNAGADPNTRYVPTPVPSLLEFVKQLFHQSPPPTNDSPTALLIACGARWYDRQNTYRQGIRSHAPQLVQAMLRRGATINGHDKGWTPLMWAVSGNRLSTASVLLEHGADVNTKDGNGSTPLSFVARSGISLEMVHFLLDHGADVNAQDNRGSTPLIAAVECGDKDTVRLLLHSGANINLQDGEDSTPLMRAIERVCVNHFPPDIVHLLLAHGANPNLEDRSEVTPLMLAQKLYRPELVALLKQAGARK